MCQKTFSLFLSLYDLKANQIWTDNEEMQKVIGVLMILTSCHVINQLANYSLRS